MGIVNIRATIACDGCAREFRVEMDPAAGPWADASLADYAEDAVRGGEVVPERGKQVDLGSCSVQDDKLLCPACTTEADALAGDPDITSTKDARHG